MSNAPQLPTVEVPAPTGIRQEMDTSDISGTSYAAAARTESTSAPITKVRPARLYGTKKVNSVEVKTVPRRLTAFVGRLHEDTTTEDLTSFLAESGLQGIRCTKLKPPAGRSFRTAAFCVSCPAEGNEHLFYNDDVCPDGAELRDWYFKEKSSKKDECETVQNC